MVVLSVGGEVGAVDRARDGCYVYNHHDIR